MASIIKNFGLYGRDASTVAPEFIHLVSIDSSCRKHNWQIKPHFHSKLFQFLFIEEGSGVFIYNEKKIKFSGMNIIIIPENHLHGFLFNEDIKGYTLSVSSYIMDKLTQNDKEILTQLNGVRILRMNNNEDEFIDSMASVNRMALEFTKPDEKTPKFQEALLFLLLIKIFRIKLEAERSYTASTRELIYYKQFMTFIKQKTPTNQPIEAYTKQLGISKTHLNRVCQSIMGGSTKQVIASYIINESKVLLTHTSMTISEIAYQLEFKDVSYFCRFFKKQVGVSPAQYRGNNAQIENTDSIVAVNY
jgi:AraC family transcriptional regulator, transcriptional activator of pobA